MARRTGLMYHEQFLAHDTGTGHPERPDRLRALLRRLEEGGLRQQMTPLPFAPASDAQLLAVHRPEHLAFVREACAAGRTLLDEGDTHVGATSAAIAALAAGGVVAAVDAVVAGTIDNAFCAVRPPGHHAESNRVMGFCLFNSIAVAARHAQIGHGLRRIAIVDWDVHHGNGTQEIFFRDDSVLFVSLHQFPLWPGTGARDEAGEGAGKGYTINIPILPGSGEPEYTAAFLREVLPALERFGPELILISCGFDAHQADPLASIDLTASSFARLTAMLCAAADRLCAGRIVSVLEGGYDLDALAASAEAHCRVLLGAPAGAI